MNALLQWCKRQPTLAMLVLVGIFAVTVRLLAGFDLDHTALLYAGCPFLIALALATFTQEGTHARWWHGWWNVTRGSLIALLGSSIILFEGWLCVALFLPIYLMFILIGFLCTLLFISVKRRGKGIFSASLIPLLVAAVALEGTIPALTVDRENAVTRTLIVDGSPPDVLARLSQPLALPQGDGWFISWFPMPYAIDAGSLAPGHIHEVHFRYKRWFVTNTHEGSLRLQIIEAGPERISTRILSNSTYLANYMTFHGTDIEMRALTDGRTRVSLTAHYSRDLDPAWYFGPLQEAAVGEALTHMLKEFIDA